MAYSDFKLEQVVEQFDLHQTGGLLFDEAEAIAPSSWLTETLASCQLFGLHSGSEKARSEFIVAPILVDISRRNPDQFKIYSGKSLDVDKQLGLNGECDFLISRDAGSRIIQAPLISVVEAKRQDIEIGLGQCSAQMVGTQRFNQQRDSAYDAVYGCVTTGELWQFLKLERQSLIIEDRSYALAAEIAKVLGIFQFILDQF